MAVNLPMPPEIANTGVGLVRCLNCSLVYLDHRPTEDSMNAIYRSDQYFGSLGNAGYTDYTIQKESLRKTFSFFLSSIVRTGIGQGSIVDVGCGNGYLLDKASNFFLFRAGSDMSESAVNKASKVCDMAVCGGPDDLLRQGLKGFDLLTLVSVLEHIYNPVEFLSTCRLLVKNGGYVAAAVPFYGSLWRKIMGHYWTSFKLPEHIAYYEKKSLTVLGKRVGLRLVKFLPYHHFFPLSVVLDKLGIHSQTVGDSRLGDLDIFLPAVMITAIFKK